MNSYAPNASEPQVWAIPAPGDLIAGKYTVQSTVGRGGIAVVLAAFHGGLGRRVAIKLLLPEWASHAEVVERFVREGRMATHIRSEHVVRIFDVGTLESGAPYQVLEFLDGKNLDEVVATSGRVPVEIAVDWILQACEAIGEAHTLGVVHRDIKPSNLVLTARADGKASIKVIDFGLSKLTATHAMTFKDERPLTMANDVMGTPHYMAPEQLRSSRDVDARVDIWALGAVLHELIAARPPFLGASVPALCASILSEPAARLSASNPNVPPELERAVLTCLEKDPRDRFATVAEFAQAIAPFRSAAASAAVVENAPVARGTAPVVAEAAPVVAAAAAPVVVGEPAAVAAAAPVAVEPARAWTQTVRLPSVRPERLELVVDEPSEGELPTAAPLVPNPVIDLHATAMYGTHLPGPAVPVPPPPVPSMTAPAQAATEPVASMTATEPVASMTAPAQAAPEAVLPMTAASAPAFPAPPAAAPADSFVSPPTFPEPAFPETMPPVTASLGAEHLPGGDLHITPLPPMPTFDPVLMRASWPDDLDPVDTPARIPGTHSSARVVLLSCLILAGLGSAAFASLYSSVHHGDASPAVGLTSPQAKAVTPPVGPTPPAVPVPAVPALPAVPAPDTSALSTTSPIANPSPVAPPVAPIAAPAVAAPAVPDPATAAAAAPVPSPAVVPPAATPAPVIVATPGKTPVAASAPAPVRTHAPTARPAPRRTHTPVPKTRKARSWTLEPTPTPTPTPPLEDTGTSSSAPAQSHDDAPAPKAPASDDSFEGRQ